MSTKTKKNNMGSFKSQICRKCRLCPAQEPYFCSMMHSINREQFARTLKHIVFLRFNNTAKYSELRTLEAFVGMFCNSGKGCGWKTPNCVLLSTQINCYETFMQQSGTGFALHEKSNLLSKYWFKDLKGLSKPYQVPDNPLSGLTKRARKRINKMVNKSVYKVKTLEERHKSRKKQNRSKPAQAKVKPKPATTEFFCSDDAEWQEKIESIFILNENGICLYNHSFMENSESLDKQFVSGTIASMNIMLKELIEKPNNETLVLRKKGKIVNIFLGNIITGVLISKEELNFFNYNLKNLVLKVEEIYKGLLINWNGDLSVFNSIKNLINEIFYI